MRVQVIFADPVYFNGLSFSQWIQGYNDDSLLLLPDVVPGANVQEILTQKNGATGVTFRLHNSADPIVKSGQKAAILGVWVNAHELESFSRMSTDPIAQQIKALTNNETCKRQVSDIVKGACSKVVLEYLDHLAVLWQLGTLAGFEHIQQDVQAYQAKAAMWLLGEDRVALETAIRDGECVPGVLATIAGKYLD